MAHLPSKATPTPWTHTPADENVRHLYHTHKWRKYRLRFLSLNPVCSCGQPAQVVDHIVPARQRPELFWSASNHQPMCSYCHNRKRSTED